MEGEARLTDHEAKMKAMEQLNDAPADGSYWRHHEGGLMRVICTTIKEDTLEPMVHYESLTYGLRLTRTLANWREWVRAEDSPAGEFRIVQRFRLATPAEVIAANGRLGREVKLS